MKRILLTLLLVFIFAVVFCWDTQIRRRRRQARKCQDRCILLLRCPTFIEMLQNRVPGAMATIRWSRCGREGFRIKVCCPVQSSDDISYYFPSECGNNPRVYDHIVHGDETEMGEYPWTVALGYTKSDDSKPNFMCSGSVINARYVLTAAHCLDPERLNGYNLSVVRVGDWDLSKEKDCFESFFGEECAPPHIDLQAEKIILHPVYSVGHELANDVALIRLNQTINFKKTEGYIMPICLPPFGLDASRLATNRDPVVVGWGETENGSSSHILLKADVPFANRSLCSMYHLESFGDNHLCVGGTLKDSCQGDSGSPLVLSGPEGPPYLQVGIVSFGVTCGAPGIPAVYTSVSAYREWIAHSLEPWWKE